MFDISIIDIKFFMLCVVLHCVLMLVLLDPSARTALAYAYNKLRWR